jgi:hypothetical protein
MVCSCPLLLGQNDYELAAEFGDVCDRADITGCLDSLRTNDSKWSVVSAQSTVTKRTPEHTHEPCCHDDHPSPHLAPVW